ncbi:MAG TPA: winged helix-turn-helix domain-containing protein [Pyrinomonadaceae bacterium]|jgi:DNA-binding winged helix-turn-helix (wHTH) protein/TolB-like protein
MSDGKKLVYEFDSFSLDPTERRLIHDGKVVALPPKAFETLVVLVENSGHLVEKETLLNKVWADSFVEEGNLKICVHTLRKALDNSKFIETVPKKGYRFNAPVRLIEKNATNFLIEKQTARRITIEATEIDEPENRLSAAPKSIARIFSQPKVYLSSILILGLILLGGFYFVKNRQSKNPSAANPLAGVKTIAVLPLKSLSVPPSEQELRVGMADSIVTKLSAVRQIAVRPTSSTIRYLDQNYDTLEVGKELKVDSILEGSVQKEGQKLKINLQMVSVADGKVLWADSFTNDLSNVLSGQESVTNRVGRLMALNLDSTSAENISQDSTNLDAQELYLKGVYALATSARKIENIIQGRDFFEQAIRLDPNFAPAYASLANTYSLAVSLNLLSPGEAYPNAEKAARRALELDPNSATAHIALGNVETDYNWNWQAGESEFKRAIELAPNLAYAHGDYSEFLARMGRFEESEYHSNLARQLNPTWINYEAVHALHLFYAHRFDESIAQSGAVIEKDPNAYLAYLYLSMAQSAKGSYAAAIKADEKAGAITGGAPPDLFVLGISYALPKDETKTNEILAKLETLSREQYADPFYFAVLYALRGDKDKAFFYLEKCRAEKSYWITTLKVFPFLDGLRSDARFAELLQQVKLDN